MHKTIDGLPGWARVGPLLSSLGARTLALISRLGIGLRPLLLRAWPPPPQIAPPGGNEEQFHKMFEHRGQSRATFFAHFPTFKQQGWVSNLEYNLIRKDGTTFPALLSATAIYDDAGTYVMSRSTVFDNTERHQAEAALRESEQQNRPLFEEAPDAVVLFEPSGRVGRRGEPLQH